MKCSALLLPAALASLSAVALPAAAASPQAGLPAAFPAAALRSNSVYSVLEAAAVGDTATLSARLAEGANANQVDELGNSPLHYAAMGNSPRMIELLLEAGADPILHNAEGRTPRQVCCQPELASCLEAAEQTRQRELELFALVAQGDEAGVRAGLARGVNPNALSADNETTLLMWGVAHGHEGVVRALLQAQPNVNAVSVKHGQTALHMAAGRGNVALIRLLVEAKADPMIASANGAYPLHDAIWRRQLEAVRALLPAYSAVNFCPKGGPHGSPLNMAISYGLEAYVRAFLEAGFNPNDARMKDAPPLILAVRSGHPRCVELLLKAGADKSAKDASGMTALDYAPEAMAPLLR